MHYFESVVSSNLSAAIGQNFAGQILLALSGGPDSVALLRAMVKLSSQQTSWRVVACHVNHGVRGVAADFDQEFCQRLCLENDVALSVVRFDKPDVISEEALRNLRYKALLEQAEQLDAPYVVTAHTLSDQNETMLFRICRGTSTNGLAGIRERRAFAGRTLLRPILSLEREQVLSYLDELSQSSCHDASNEAITYTRNFLRHQIFPALKERFGGLSHNMERLRLSVERQNDYLDQSARDQIAQMKMFGGYSLSHVQKLHAALSSRVFALLLQEHGVEASFARLERCLWLVSEAPAGRYSLGNGIDMVIDAQLWKFANTIEAGEELLVSLRQAMPAIAVEPARAGVRHIMVPWLNKALRLETLEAVATSQFPQRRAHNCLLDLSRVTGPLVFRLREDGDRIQPLGMDSMVRLKQYLHANKDGPALLARLDARQAQRLTPVLADSVEILWVPGYGLSQKVKVQSVPTHRLDLIDLIPDQSSISSDVC